MAIERDLTRRVPSVIEMRNVPYDQQKQIFVYVTKRLPRWGAGKLDATGNGDYLAEAAAQEFGGERIERVKLLQGWYAQNMPRMKSGFEDRTIIIPANDNIVDDLRQVRIVQGIAMVPQDRKSTRLNSSH